MDRSVCQYLKLEDDELIGKQNTRNSIIAKYRRFFVLKEKGKWSKYTNTSPVKGQRLCPSFFCLPFSSPAEHLNCIIIVELKVLAALLGCRTGSGGKDNIVSSIVKAFEELDDFQANTFITIFNDLYVSRPNNRHGYTRFMIRLTKDQLLLIDHLRTKYKNHPIRSQSARHLEAESDDDDQAYEPFDIPLPTLLAEPLFTNVLRYPFCDQNDKCFVQRMYFRLEAKLLAPKFTANCGIRINLEIEDISGDDFLFDMTEAEIFDTIASFSASSENLDTNDARFKPFLRQLYIVSKFDFTCSACRGDQMLNFFISKDFTLYTELESPVMVREEMVTYRLFAYGHLKDFDQERMSNLMLRFVITDIPEENSAKINRQTRIESIRKDFYLDAPSIDEAKTSLICPISFKRIERAMRGLACKHIQCFDASIVVNDRKHCPICGMYSEHFYLDKYMMSILKDCDQSIDSVTINTSSGTWSVDRKFEHAVEISDYEEEVTIPIESPAIRIKPDPNVDNNSIDFILISSDEDEQIVNENDNSVIYLL